MSGESFSTANRWQGLLLALAIKDAKAQPSHVLLQQLGLPRREERVRLQYLRVTYGYTRVNLLLQHIARED